MSRRAEKVVSVTGKEVGERREGPDEAEGFGFDEVEGFDVDEVKDFGLEDWG
jgi:hypothetical protein